MVFLTSTYFGWLISAQCSASYKIQSFLYETLHWLKCFNVNIEILSNGKQIFFPQITDENLRESAEFHGCYAIRWEKNGKLWHACLLSSKNTERISVKEAWNGVTKQFGSEKCPNSESFALEPHRDRSEGALRLSSSKILYPSVVQRKYLMFPQIQKIHLFHPWNKIKRFFFF